MKTAFLAGVGALALAAAPAALHALTAAEAWQNMQAAAADAGMTLRAGAEAATGGRLTVTDILFSATLTEDAEAGADGGPTEIATRIPEMVFSERQDGTVAIALPQDLPVSVSFTSQEEGTARLDFILSHEDLSIVAGDGPEGGTTLDYAAASLRAVLTEVVPADPDAPGADADYDVTLTVADLSSANAYGGGDFPAIRTETTAGAAGLDMSVDDPASEASFQLALAVTDLVSRSAGSGSFLFSGSSDLAALAAPGFASEGAGGVGTLSLQMAGRDETGVPFAVGLTTGAIAGTGRVAEGQLAYELDYGDVAFTLSGGGLPVPQITGALGGLGTTLAMPLRATEAAQPFRLRLALTDLALGEELWAMFDPAAVLPRAPATLIADLAGMARWLVDPTDEAAMAAAEASPVEVERLDIAELRLSLSGAELTGTGGVALDWSRDGPFGPGTPVPQGGLSLLLTGGQGLLDDLVRMGLVTEENAMMTRMMAGALARPGEGPDTLVSEITVQPDGTVLANGAPLPF